jgi:hypothetical protein
VKPWEILLRRLQTARSWPIASERHVRAWLAIWTALRENDEPRIRGLMKWPSDRPLIIDNLPEKIASAYGDLLFGSDPLWHPADEGDADRLSAMTDTWPAELPAAEETCVSEGEVWWRLTTNPALPHPILTWHSRADVVPLLHGRTVLAAAFVDRLQPTSDDPRVVWRHVELHGAGLVLNLLFRGRDTALGESVALTRHPETEILPESWRTQLPFLICGRIVNRWGRRPLVGQSIYKGTWSRCLALNEATTVGRENMRLTAKKRAMMPQSAARVPLGRPDGSIDSIDRGDGMRIPVHGPQIAVDAGEEIIFHDPLDVDEGGNQVPPFKVLEYSFEADQLIAWLKSETATICQRCDVVPQFIGEGDFGQAESGTALRVRLLPTVNAGESRGRAWDTELPIITQRAQLLEAQAVAFGGLGNSAWTNPAGLPAVERSDTLPIDEDQQATRHATLKNSDLISIETSLRERYPDRDDQWIADERDRILADATATMPSVPTFGA